MPETFKFVEDRFTPPAPLPSTTQDTGGFETFELVDEFAPPQPAEEVEEFPVMETVYDRHGKKVSVPVYGDNGKRIHRPKYDSTGKMTHNERGVMTYDEWLKQKNEGDVDWWRVAKDAVTHLAGGFTKIPDKIEKEGWMEASANIPESFLAAMEGLRLIGGGTGRFLAKPFRTDEEQNKAEYEAYADFGNQIFRQLEMRKSRMGDIARMFGADELAEVYDDGIDPEVADSLSLIFDPTYLVGGGLVKVGAAATRQVPKVTNKYAKKMIQAAGKAAETKLAKEALATLANPVTKTVSGAGMVGEKLGRGLQIGGEKAAEWAVKHPGKAKTAQMAVGAGTGYAVAPEGRKIEGTIGGAIGGRYAFDPKRVIGAGETLEKAAQRMGGAAQAARINTVRTSGLGTVAKIRPMREEVAKQFVTYDNRMANRILQEAGKLADTAAVGAGMGAGLGSMMPTDPNNPGWAAGLGIGTFAAPAGMYSGKALNQLARVEIGRGGVPSAGVRLRIKETPDHQLSSEAVVKRFAAGLPEEQRVRFIDADRGLSIHDLANQAETVNWAMGAKRYAGKDVDLFVGNAQEVVAKTGNPFHEAQAGFYDPATNTIYLNTDAEISATTLLHEVFHPTETWSSRQKKLDTELEETVEVDPLQDLQTDMVQTIVGTYAPDGTQIKAGLYSADELASFIDQYNSRLYPDQSDNIKRVKADIDAELAKPKPDEAKLRLMNRDIAELNARQEHRDTELAAFEALPESEKRNYIAREILSEQFAMFGESARHGIIRKARNIALKKDYFKDQFLGMEIDKLKFNTLGRLRKTLEQVGVEFDLAGNPRGDMTATSVLFKDPTTGRQMAMSPDIEHLIAQYINEKDKLVARVSETGEVGGSEVTFKASDAAKKNADGTPKIPASVIERWAESGWVKTYKSKKTPTKKATDDKPADKKATDDKPADKKATDDKPADKKATDDKLKDGDILNSAGGKWQPGQRPAFTTKQERTRMEKDRVAALVAALEPVTKQVGEDEESVGVVQFRETADGGKNFSGGYFDDAQMQAIMDAPDDVVRPAFKENIRMMNEAVKNRSGQPFLADYWKAITGRGYDSKARMKVQLFTPIGMEISSAGNFNATVFNIGYFEQKINRWLGQTGKKKFWKEWADDDGRVDVDAFRNDVIELLGTHLADDPAKKYPEGVKKEKMYSFLGVKPFEPGRKDWNTSAKDRKQIIKLRMDRTQNLTPGMGDNFPINYGKARARYMPGEPARPPVDDLGFYSRVAEVAASDKIPTRATGEQMLATIAKQPGVKKEEIAWLGLEEFLRGKDRVTKDELGEFIRENDVRLEETVFYDTSPETSLSLSYDQLESPTKHGEYQLPGAEPGSYREMVLRLPEGDKQTYRSTHWNEPNVLAHVRFNDRTGPNGEKILFVEEVQSDWHREGRERGYAGAYPTKLEIAAIKSGMSSEQAKADIKHLLEEPLTRDNRPTNEQWKRLSKAVENTDIDLNAIFHDQSDIPDAPFKTSWHELAMKRMLRHAAENGYDKLAWIDGEETAKRYDLSTKVGKLVVSKSDETGKIALDADGELVDSSIDPQRLESYVGKEVAKRALDMLESESSDMGGNKSVELTGDDLQVGGQWASNLYDRMIPQFMKKYGKKWGAKVEDVEISLGDPDELKMTGVEVEPTNFKSIDITPAMRGDERGSVVGGQVKFMPGGEPVTYRGREVADWSPEDFADFGKQFGVDNFGPQSKIMPVADQDGKSVSLPGGLDGEFTFYDLLWLKANPIDPSTLSKSLTSKLQQKLVRSVTPEPGDRVEVFNRFLFGMLSPNQPLTPNEFEFAAMRVRTPDDIDKLASFIDWEPGEKVDKSRRKAAEQQMTEFYETQASGAGGMGLKGSADYTNLAEFAKLYKKDPDFFTKKPDESWDQFVEKVMTQARGLSAKVASFSVVWQDPVHAAISAIDRHMARNFLPKLFPTKKSRQQFERSVVKRWNSLVDARRNLDSKFQKTITKYNRTKASNRSDELKAEYKKYKDELLKLPKAPKSELKKVRNMDEVFRVQGGDAAFMDRVMSVLSSNERKFEARGERNPMVPDYLHDVDWINRPDKASVIGDAYRQALAENDRRAQQSGLHLFASQWHLWDRIRRRLEPHEVMFPGLHKIPKMNRSQLEKAMNVHKEAGYWSSVKEPYREPTTGEVEMRMKPTRPMPGGPASAAYFMPATPGPRTPTQITPTSEPVNLVMDKIYRLPEEEKEERKDRAIQILEKFSKP